MGKGSFFTVSCKQKINTRSSTEAELVAVYDCMSHLLWLRNFLLGQGYEKAKTIDVLQDNQSAILLEQNGILSSTQRTKHLNSRYFYVKDRVDNKEIAIVWCPTDKIVADYLTKPLTGEKFHHFRLKIMNMRGLKMESLRPNTPKDTSLSQLEKPNGQKLRKTAIKSLKNRLSNAGSSESGLREWSRIDKKAARYVTTDIDGPPWKDVVSRTTYDLTGDNNRIIEHITIDKGVGAATLHRKLPPRVSEIRTVLCYRDKTVGSSADGKAVKKKWAKECQDGLDKTLYKNQFLANRKKKGSKRDKVGDCYFCGPPDSGTSL